MSRSSIFPEPPASVTAARLVAHMARLLAVLSVAAQAGMLAMELGWVLEGRLALGDVGDRALALVLSVAGALVVWWLSARVLAATRTTFNAPVGRP